MLSTGSCGKRSKKKRPEPTLRSRNTSRKLTTRVTKNLLSVRSTCLEQRKLLRVLEDLDQQEREMYELDNCKDQVMTVCKVALANLGMWMHDQWFPAENAHASWHRMQVFFQLRGGSSGGDI